MYFSLCSLEVGVFDLFFWMISGSFVALNCIWRPVSVFFCFFLQYPRYNIDMMKNFKALAIVFPTTNKKYSWFKVLLVNLIVNSSSPIHGIGSQTHNYASSVASIPHNPDCPWCWWEYHTVGLLCATRCPPVVSDSPWGQRCYSSVSCSPPEPLGHRKVEYRVLTTRFVTWPNV